MADEKRLKTQKPTVKVQTKITDKKNMVKLVLQNKQICILKSHKFASKHQKYCRKITKNMK